MIRGLLGYHRFTTGRVQVLGCDPYSNALDLRRRIGYVSDAPGLYEWMSIAEIGWYAAGLYPPGYQKRFGELCAGFGLPPDAKISQLSKGMRAQVALALAMAFDPELLVLDEPTSGLDPLVRRTFLESMIDRAASGQTVFLSSHQIHEVERVADFVAILHAGKLQVVGNLEDLKSQVAILKFSMRDPLLASPAVLSELDILNCRIEGRTWRLMVRHPKPDLSMQLEKDPNVFELSIVRPNLEELYLGFTQSESSKLPLPDRSEQQSGVA